jgi:hypothetical protein
VLRQYLLLVRLPNTFTATSNILTGYFALVLPSYVNVSNLVILMITSALLYLSGIVFNDYFDIEVDRKERPFRPLPSGKVTKQKALIIAVASMIIANGIAYSVSAASLVIAILLSATVIAYDYRLKATVIGPMTMGCARFLNVFLGASPALLAVMILQDGNRNYPIGPNCYQPFFNNFCCHYNNSLCNFLYDFSNRFSSKSNLIFRRNSHYLQTDSLSRFLISRYSKGYQDYSAFHHSS